MIKSWTTLTLQEITTLFFGNPHEMACSALSNADWIKASRISASDESGIFNLGTGQAQPFNDVACAVVNSLRKAAGEPPLTLPELVKAGLIQYMPFPADLKGKYQCFTQADMQQLRAIGYSDSFLNVEQGVSRYVDWLSANADFLAQPI